MNKLILNSWIFWLQIYYKNLQTCEVNNFGSCLQATLNTKHLTTTKTYLLMIFHLSQYLDEATEETKQH